MDIASGFVFYPLAVESILLIIFLLVLFTRGTREGRYIWLTAAIVIVIFSVLSITNAIAISAIPIGPPPVIWEEGYYDALAMRSLIYMRAEIESIYLLILSSSYTFMKFKETQSDSN